MISSTIRFGVSIFVVRAFWVREKCVYGKQQLRMFYFGWFDGKHTHTHRTNTVQFQIRIEHAPNRFYSKCQQRNEKENARRTKLLVVIYCLLHIVFIWFSSFSSIYFYDLNTYKYFLCKLNSFFVCEFCFFQWCIAVYVCVVVFEVCVMSFFTNLMLSILCAAVIIRFGCFWNIDHGFCDEPSSIRYLLWVSMARRL